LPVYELVGLVFPQIVGRIVPALVPL